MEQPEDPNKGSVCFFDSEISGTLECLGSCIKEKCQQSIFLQGKLLRHKPELFAHRLSLFSITVHAVAQTESLLAPREDLLVLVFALGAPGLAEATGRICRLRGHKHPQGFAVIFTHISFSFPTSPPSPQAQGPLCHLFCPEEQ